LLPDATALRLETYDIDDTTAQITLRWAEPSNFCATSLRCQARMVSGLTMLATSSNTHGGELYIIFLTASCGERVNPGFADAAL
jgi:hypothetical protein